jgi:hypothetical protein
VKVKVKVKLSLCLTKYHTMKVYHVLSKHHTINIYGGVEPVETQLILQLMINGFSKQAIFNI